MTPVAPPLRVVVVDDDDVTRSGCASILDADPRLRVTASLTHDQALAGIDWDAVDVAVVDASDRRQADDQFPGVAVVESARAGSPRQQVRVIVLTGVLFDDAVRCRMREAGADAYYHRSELCDAALLCDAVARPEADREVPDPVDWATLDRLGVTSTSAVNQGVAAADAFGLRSGSREVGSRGRDRQHRRERFNERARLRVVNLDGRPPDREQAAPSLSQVDRFLRWATRIGDDERRRPTR